MKGDKLLQVADEVDHRHAVVRLAEHYEWQRGAELGLASGHLSRRLLEALPHLHLIGVDSMQRADREARVRELQARFPSRYRVMAKTTVQAAAKVPDASLDFIFIDAGHSYRAVRDDIAAWRGKVRVGGAILGHDYGHPRYDGVAQATNEAFGNRVQLLGHTIWGVVTC